VQGVPYPVEFSVEYPDRDLNRLTTFFRLFTVIPIALVAAAIVERGYGDYWYVNLAYVAGAGMGLIGLPTGLMILFRKKYPRWWFDWNLELMRFVARIGIYSALMDDRYPSTDEQQSVHLDFPYPDVERDLGRWMPVFKWLLLIPHYIALFFVFIALVLVLVIAWFAILFTGRYPRSLFQFSEGVHRWYYRVIAYGFALVTDRYPPFGLR
jgi:Domain of unknown function (DUF4389)